MEEETGGAAPPALRLVNFISEGQLDQAKKTRGERADDGSAQRDRPLFEILRENKDRKDAEFNERFKHRPPKALDEDETEFLEKLEMSRREHERHVADEEAQQLRSFQEAVVAHSSVVHELKETPSISRPEPKENKPSVKRNQHLRPGNFIIAVKPQAKKSKTEAASDETSDTKKPLNGHMNEKPADTADGILGGLVSYSDESEGDD